MNTTNTTNTTAPTTATPSIASSAMLVDLSISLWDGKKSDKAVANKVKADAGASGHVGVFRKSLLPNEPTFEKVLKLATQIRSEHYHRTMAWSDRGPRLLPTKAFFDYQQVISGLMTQFEAAVEALVAEFNDMEARAAIRLGDLYDPSDYPNWYTLQSRFSARVAYIPVPEAGDFRVDVGNQALAELQSSYATYYESQLTSAYNDVWERTHKVLSNMSTRLGSEKDKPLFHDTLVSNVAEMAELLGQFNITNDPALARAQAKIVDALQGVTPDKLRASPSLRESTKAAVDAVLSEFSW